MPLAHRGTVNVVFLAPIHQSAADVFSIVFHVFSHSWVSIFALIIYIAPIKYDSSFLICANLFSSGQGRRNDIKPSCQLSSNQEPPGTGVFVVFFCTNIASPANAPTVTPVIATKDQQESDVCINDSHFPQDVFGNDLSGCDEFRDDKGDNSLDSFSGFLDPGDRFAITTDSVHRPHLPGFIRSDVESCHGRIEQISPQRITSNT